MKAYIQKQIYYIDNIVGQNLKKHRVRLKLSQQEIAAILGVSVQQVRKYENCTNRISSGKLYKISCLFGIPLKKFFKEN
jgi:transcriptional regulator with XRE-family HTH domain